MERSSQNVAFRVTLKRSPADMVRVVVGRRVSKKAAVRNEIRRQVREWCRQQGALPRQTAVTIYVSPSILQYSRPQRYRLLARQFEQAP
ncbi:ribonuclease P protein component [Candidatus Parcubacteria bacterium]|nr:ribonuclease P protein component [Candidatus Parcubacteria bacterium]